MSKVKENIEFFKLMKKYDITYEQGDFKIHKKIKVQDLKYLRAILIINHIDYKDIIVEV